MNENPGLLPPPDNATPFERIKRTNAAGADYWSSRDFADVLGYEKYANFEQVVAKARVACFNSGQRIEDHFVDITEMITSDRPLVRPGRGLSSVLTTLRLRGGPRSAVNVSPARGVALGGA